MKKTGLAPEGTLDLFHPLVEQWFRARFEAPTDVQQRAWPIIAEEKHALITAPTGSGKTMAAFLWALNQLITGAWPNGATRVIYVSPMKALNTDVRRNLIAPLNELHETFIEAGESFPEIHVRTRSGDTEASERRAMIRRPPEILITTPESLNILLSSESGRIFFPEVCTVILDEIHAIAGSKRGVHCMSAVDRIVQRAGAFQRIALTATLHPPEALTRFVGGYEMSGDPRDPEYMPRPVEIVVSNAPKQLELHVAYPQRPQLSEEEDEETARWAQLAARIIARLESNRSTLVFTNSRRICERVALHMNNLAGRLVAYAHHGSLSRELRQVVEKRLKAGELEAIVATNSLELGIDVGELDEVVLVQTPPTVASALQRIGRAGHSVGRTSRGLFLPAYARDLLHAAVMVQAVHARDIEPIHPIQAPLDVLCQTLISMTSTDEWDLDHLYAVIRSSGPYYSLSRRQFDLVIDMLAGRYADKRLRALQPLVSVDRTRNTVRARKGAVRRIYFSGGTIVDRGLYSLRRADTMAKVGELDEEFVWERHLGDTFSLGSQTWRIQAITHNDVLVVPGSGKAPDAPFWRADDVSGGFHFGERLGTFLEEVSSQDDAALKKRLKSEFAFDDEAADALCAFLQRQREWTGVELPHRHHVVAELVTDAVQFPDRTQLILHTHWGGKVNKPYALALAQAWQDRYGTRLEVFANNECLALILPGEGDIDAVFDLVTPENLEVLLRKRLEQTGLFGARFRESAGIALQLPRQQFDKRMPLWMNRLRAKQLLDSIMDTPDFPILVEVWRTCLQDDFELEALTNLLGELATGEIRVSVCHTTTPSPFAEGMAWRQTNQYMYADDTPTSPRASALQDELIREVARSGALRPRIPRAVAEQFQLKAQRLFSGYAPGSAEELIDWVHDRVLIPLEEWNALREAMVRDHDVELAAIDGEIGNRIESFENFIATPENAERTRLVFAGTGDDSAETPTLAAWLSEWLRFYGPVPLDWLKQMLPVDSERLAAALEELVEDETLIVDTLLEDAETEEVCDRLNLERLLRMTRTAARPAFQPLAIEDLPLFLAEWQGIANPPADPRAALQRAIEPLFACPIAADQLETNVLPARVPGYTAAMLDSLAAETGLQWYGGGKEMVYLGFPELLDLTQPDRSEENTDGLLPPSGAHVPLLEICRGQDKPQEAVLSELWKQAWDGRAANDTFAALRKGVQLKFKADTGRTGATRAGMRASFARFRAAATMPGNWFAIPPPELPADMLEDEERNRDRARILLDRYGVLFREILQNELPAFRWGSVFRSLRLMELAGEVVAGQFFEGITGLQFAAPAALRRLRQKLPGDAVYWLCATDPASICGLGIEAFKGDIPKRMATNYLVYHGARLVVIVTANGKQIDFMVEPDDENLERYLGVLDHLLTRDVQPLSAITIEKINGESAPQSPYLDTLRARYESSASPKNVRLLQRRP